MIDSPPLVEECKRRWKNLRDRYFKEVRQEKRSKEEQGALTPSRWKYRQLLNFLEPFIKPRNTNMDRDDQENPDGTTDGEAKPAETQTAQVSMKTPTTQAGTVSQLAFVTQLSGSQNSQLAQLAFLAKLPPSAQISAVPQQSSGKKRRQVKEPESPASPCSSSTPAKAPTKTKRLAKEADDHISDSNKPRDEDELFLLSFVPVLKRLSPQKRCATKIKIQQIMHDAEFSVEPSMSQGEQPET